MNQKLLRTREYLISILATFDYFFVTQNRKKENLRVIKIL